MTAWTAEQKAAGFPHMERIFPTRRIAAGPDPIALLERPVDLGRVGFEADGVSYGLEEFLDRFNVYGFLVLADGAVAHEEYRNGHGRSERWMSFSVAKSVVSLLVGAAVRDGLIGSVDEPVTRYLPALTGSSYDGVRITDLLHMASGVSWSEDYLDLDSDVNRTFRLTLDEQIAYMGALPRVAPPGSVFNYNTGETDLVGELLRHAVGGTLSDYLGRTIWRPFGMEADAYWLLYDTGADEYGGTGLNATLRDYGRIGLFALRGGVLPDGTRVLPEGWMEASTTPSPANEAYGRFWWLRGGGVYAAQGIYGQMIWIDPAAGVVIVTQSAWEEPTGSFPAYHAMARAVVDAVAATEATR
ncbi:MAG TPA: serine hydrolase domain-containing protein [Longimicrobiales bacterium]|nr:serine hydrolase domain-containing protein [Longimicrobiales bacterium]